MPHENAVGYAGDVSAKEAFDILATAGGSVLIDVRTRAEWSYVGAPDLTSIGKSVLFLEWQSYPSMQVDPDFAGRLTSQLAAAGIARDASLVFLCRSGVRSRNAAIAMTRAGWARCLNVSDGFEGPLDSRGHRNLVGGWRADGLPWKQT